MWCASTGVIHLLFLVVGIHQAFIQRGRKMTHCQNVAFPLFSARLLKKRFVLLAVFLILSTSACDDATVPIQEGGGSS